MISLVTYSYNDHEFVLDLLEKAKDLQPFVAEIIVVDDGSTPAFPLVAGHNSNIRIITHQNNRGPAEAKKIGLNAATQSFILSVDSDIRFHRNWLLSALAALRDDEVGLVGARILNKDFGDPLSKALHYESLARPAAEPSLFAPGGLWLLRQTTFHALGGLNDYMQSTHEDWHFSRKVTGAGLRIVVNWAFPATQVRRIRRKAHIRRDCLYFEDSYRRIIEKRPADAVIALMAEEVEQALAIALKFHCPLLVYLCVAKLLRIMTSISGAYSSHEAMRQVSTSLDAAFGRYPAVAAALRSDCDITLCTSPGPSTVGSMASILQYMRRLVGESVLHCLDSDTIPASNAHEASGTYNFHYASQ